LEKRIENHINTKLHKKKTSSLNPNNSTNPNIPNASTKPEIQTGMKFTQQFSEGKMRGEILEMSGGQLRIEFTDQTGRKRPKRLSILHFEQNIADKTIILETN
jgi:hypothetical protein